MDENAPKKSNLVTKVLFAKLKLILIIVLAVFIAFIVIMGGAFKIFKDKINSLAEQQLEHEQNLTITEEGIQSKESKERRYIDGLKIQVAATIENQNRYNRIAIMEANSLQKVSDLNNDLTYKILLAQQEFEEVESLLDADTQTDQGVAKSRAEELASELKWLEEYIDDSLLQTKEQKLAYLMNAGIVNKYPYIDAIAGDSTKLNGTIKFKRYLSSLDGNDTREIKLTFINKSSFDEKLNNYRASGDEDVYNYFTIDEDENVLIAYGTKTTKTITTTDNEVSLEKINEISAETYSKTGDGTYKAEIYTINTKPIDYQSLAEPYALPFNLLATLLIQTRNYSMVKEIADLAYNSEIVIGIYDNKSITDNNDEYLYNKKIKYTENTKLIFDNVDTDPQVDISASEYSEVVKECFGKLDETRENSIHCSGIALEDLETATGNRTDGNVYQAYISEISEDGVVTAISDTAVDFKTTMNVHTVANAAPTVGVALADVWAGKWTATYTEEADPKGPDVTSTTLDDEELVKIENSKFAEALLAEDGSIGTNLKEHSDNLKEKAIEKIIEKTTFTVRARAMTGADVRSHGNGCVECAGKLTAQYGVYWIFQTPDISGYISDETLLNDVKNADDEDDNDENDTLVGIQEHIENELEAAADEKTEERKEKFIEDITEQITYDQWPTTYKANQSIRQENTYSKEMTTYKKDSTNMEDEGKEFAKILSKSKYRETKDALLTRQAWFWDSIREYEETAKIENLLRYLFNIAYKTNAFGTFTEEDIANIFNIFEPQTMLSTSMIYGNTIEAKVWNALVNAGYSKFAAAGAMGNIYHESRFDSAVVEYENGIGFGLCQWSFGRRTQLEAYAASKGVEPSDVNTQIEFLITEITPGAVGPAQGYASYQLLTYNGYNGEMWINAETPEEAAIAFCWSFERPNKEKANVTGRQQKALEYYNKYKDLDAGGYFESDTSGDARIIGTFTSGITGRTFTIFNQSQISGWSMSCNRAAQASICSGYWDKGNDDVIEKLKEAGENVAPRYNDFYEECGLTYSSQQLTSKYTFDANKIREQVQNGGYVVVYVRGSWDGTDGVSKYGRDWASKAHWVSIIGYREIDGAEKIFVSDSGHKLSGWWPLDEFDGILKSVVFVNEK